MFHMYHLAPEILRFHPIPPFIFPLQFTVPLIQYPTSFFLYSPFNPIRVSPSLPFNFNRSTLRYKYLFIKYIPNKLYILELFLLSKIPPFIFPLQFTIPLILYPLSLFLYSPFNPIPPFIFPLQSL